MPDELPLEDESGEEEQGSLALHDGEEPGNAEDEEIKDEAGRAASEPAAEEPGEEI
jgi:hypothetical protein